MSQDQDWDVQTHAIRTGQLGTEFGSHSEALFLTSSFTFGSAAEAAARFSGAEPGFIYTRFSNPTIAAFEQRLAAMEGGERCIATASGMSAIQALVMALCKSGDEIVSSRSVFGTTTVLFDKYFSRFGVRTTFVDLKDPAAWRNAITDKTRLLFLETPSNPLSEVADIRALAAIAREAGCLLVVDNCFCTPALQTPLSLGADVIIHSATKYLDGQGRCVGGAVVGPHALMEEVYGFLRTGGPSMSPFNAWVFLKGLETLSLRMEAHSRSALRIARRLEQHPSVERVFYSGLDSHPQHALAASQQKAFGGVLAFEIRGTRDDAWRVIDRLRLFSITANLGDAKSTVTHPATTTHGRVPAEDRARAGIRDTLVRLSVGLESCDDLLMDLERALQ
jgi:O-succinylhomoserine sulfhydrylase